MDKVKMKEIIDTYIQIYGQMRSKYRWNVSDQRILVMAASFYVVKGEPFNFNAYTKLTDYIKKQSPLFSTMRSHQRFITAAMLDIRFDVPLERFAEFTDLYEKLVKGGFKRGPFTYISALVMLSGDPDDSTHQESIQRSLDGHNGMKQHHPFITSKNDYPLSVLLAQLDEEVDPLMEHVESYYRKLNQNGFRKGNDLQFLSHILAMVKDSSADELINRCILIVDEFKRRKIKMKAMHYPEIGLLAIIDARATLLDDVENIRTRLNREKWFKWQKDINTILAVNFAIREKVEDNDVLQTGIYTTMETIIQAQQAAMIAALAGGSVAATSGSSN